MTLSLIELVISGVMHFLEPSLSDLTSGAFVFLSQSLSGSSTQINMPVAACCLVRSCAVVE